MPWTRLAWVSWRQHRGALAGATVLLGAIAAYLAITGRHIHQAYNAYAACLAAFPQAAASSGQGGLYAGCAPAGRAFLSFDGTTSGPLVAASAHRGRLAPCRLAPPIHRDHPPDPPPPRLTPV